MVFVKHMKGPLKEPGLGRSRRPVWTDITVAATGQASLSGNALVPKTPEAFTYDADGNLTSDSLWTNVWNAENRLVLTESAAGVPTGARLRETWSYLPDGRWIERIVLTNSGSAYHPAWTNRYVWDGQVLLAILDHTNGLVMSFVRGLDLSGSMDGAGGVGGVLAVTFRSNGTHFVCYDGNGNVMALTDAATGANSAMFEYGPFGEPLRVTGPAAAAMPLRFSTMYEDDVTGDRKYLFREYAPSLGRWLSRDPVGEWGGQNFCAFVGNNPANYYDLFGLEAELGPLTPDGQHIDDQGSIWKDRHNNYVTFHATCPACTRLANVRIDYGNMCGCMYAAFLKGRPPAPSSPGRWPNPPKSQEEYCQGVMWLLGGTFGGVRRPNEREGNCVGRPEEIQAFMRTRLVSPDWMAALYRFVNDLPPASDTASCYMQHTRAYYQCKKCGN